MHPHSIKKSFFTETFLSNQDLKGKWSIQTDGKDLGLYVCHKHGLLSITLSAILPGKTLLPTGPHRDNSHDFYRYKSRVWTVSWYASKEIMSIQLHFPCMEAIFTVLCTLWVTPPTTECVQKLLQHECLQTTGTVSVPQTNDLLRV